MTFRRILVPAVIAGATLAGVSASSAQTVLPTLTVAASKSAVTVSGAVTAGAVEVAQSSSVDTSVGLFRLADGVTADQFLAALPKAQNPDGLMKLGSIVYDASAPKGSSTRQTILPAGNYLAVNQAGGNPSKWSHTTFTVGAATGTPATLPRADARIRAIDFAFRSPKTLKRGSVVRLEDDGYVSHEVAAIRVKNRKTARKLSRYLKAGKDGKAQKVASGFFELQSPVTPGAVQQQALEIPKGTYVLACFMTTQDGREHTRLGMYRTVRVK